jgi:hypothetical protein
MHSLPRAECEHLAGPLLHSAPQRRRASADQPPDQHRAGGHRKESDPRRLLFGARQAQAVQRDLGQPRPKRAASGDEETGAALRAQSSFEILRFAEHRGDAARHFLVTSLVCSRAR